jgi:hypothetical protein
VQFQVARERQLKQAQQPVREQREPELFPGDDLEVKKGNFEEGLARI